MFRASSCPSSGATNTAVAASGLPLERGNSSAVGRGRADCLCLQISLWTSRYILYITLYLTVINTNIYYVLLDGLHGHMFRLLRGHLQTIKIHEIKTTFATSLWNV